MRKILLSLGWLSAVASAQPVTPNNQIVHFNGRILNQTCTVDNGSRNRTVMLPDVRKAMLAANGQTAGTTSFEIKLTGCTDGDDKPYLMFMPGAMTDMMTGNLKNMARNGASNVQVQLLPKDSDTPIKLGAPMAGKLSMPAMSKSGIVTLTYQARYYATGMATAGAVQASVNYTIAYQ